MCSSDLRMFRPPFELSLGEAYIYGDFDIEGDIFAAFSLIDASLNRRFSLDDIVALTRAILALQIGRASCRERV